MQYPEKKFFVFPQLRYVLRMFLKFSQILGSTKRVALDSKNNRPLSNVKTSLQWIIQKGPSYIF